MSKSEDPDGMARYEPSHLDLCCLQKPIIIACGCERVKNTARELHFFIVSLEQTQPFLSPAFSTKSEVTWYSAFRGVWFRVCSRYLVSIKSPTVLDRSF